MCPGAYSEEPEEGEKMRACDSLIMCIITSINQGLRNGGGIGDVLRKPSKNVSCHIPTRMCLLSLLIGYLSRWLSTTYCVLLFYACCLGTLQKSGFPTHPLRIWPIKIVRSQFTLGKNMGPNTTYSTYSYLEGSVISAP